MKKFSLSFLLLFSSKAFSEYFQHFIRDQKKKDGEELITKKQHQLQQENRKKDSLPFVLSLAKNILQNEVLFS
jgi:hypothetical protein